MFIKTTFEQLILNSLLGISLTVTLKVEGLK
ncbi:hypothetical protein PAP_01335 [Palaeococcus pacificus DY20341]|uniref:Uncharacterized protein n=1 Tax=Palaeococcus pacificus DY20341 TaxID=1343739 RepID=A0A075LQY0_9EURY|nr:hypothetical protein PAP_01335 [Palaeococcus pacificus DY20341]